MNKDKFADKFQPIFDKACVMCCTNKYGQFERWILPRK